jgi:hypothetical protein
MKEAGLHKQEAHPEPFFLSRIDTHISNLNPFP